jgi:predicted AAA+ superfamily ATPase
VARGNSAQNILTGQAEGVGKTVLLDRMRTDAEAEGIHTIQVESPERKSLPALLAPQLRIALFFG